MSENLQPYQTNPEAMVTTLAVATAAPAETAVSYDEPYSPDEQFPELFSRIAVMRHLVGYSDGKLLVDCEPLGGPQEVARHLQEAALLTDEDHMLFWRRHLHAPSYVDDIKEMASAESGVPFETHISNMWDRLTYHSPQDHGTLLGTRYPRLKPGERYAEGYYWDTSDGLEGLMAEAENDPRRWRQVLGELRNFADTINRFGFIPNGMRSYYLSRSQPPKFAHMVQRVAEMYDNGSHYSAIVEEFLPQVVNEYNWWMKGTEQLDPKAGVRAADHVVLMPDGEVLNRYWDTKETPRPESYLEDIETAERLPSEKAPVFYRNVRIIAASGRDMNGELLDDPERLETAAAERVVPVDLNSMLWEYEDLIARAHDAAGRSVPARMFHERAERRAAAINKYNYVGDDQTGYYSAFKFTDMTFTHGAPTGYPSMNMAIPVARGIAPTARAESVCRKLTSEFLQAGGFVASLRETGQQWDWPNGWAPDQEEAVNALSRTTERTGNQIWRMWADVAKLRWLNHHATVYRAVGKIAEKCNVCLANPLDVQDGEYPLQFGFLWTNGILRKFLSSTIQAPAQLIIGSSAKL